MIPLRQETTACQTALVDQSQLEALSQQLGHHTLIELLFGFEKDVTNLVGCIRRLAAIGHFEEVQRMVASLNSVSKDYGASELARLSSQIAWDIEQVNPDQALVRIHDVERVALMTLNAQKAFAGVLRIRAEKTCFKPVAVAGQASGPE